MSTDEQLAQALRMALRELRSVLDAINADRIPHDGDDFHECLRVGDDALAKHAAEAQARAAEARYAAPIGWMIEGSDRVWRGDFARADAEQSARFVGGTCRAFPIYRDAPAAPAAGPLDEAAESLAGMVAEWVDSGIKSGSDWRSGLTDAIRQRLARFAAPAAPVASPVLVRDVADMLGTTVAAVSAAVVALGHAPRSTNMAVTGEEAVQVAAHLRAAPAATRMLSGQWAIVPFEPTTTMLIAGNHCQPGEYSAALVWRAMIEAARGTTDYLSPLPQDLVLPNTSRAKLEGGQG